MRLLAAIGTSVGTGLVLFLSCIAFIVFIAFILLILVFIPGFLIGAQWDALFIPDWAHILITIIGVAYTLFVYGWTYIKS